MKVPFQVLVPALNANGLRPDTRQRPSCRLPPSRKQVTRPWAVGFGLSGKEFGATKSWHHNLSTWVTAPYIITFRVCFYEHLVGQDAGA